MLPKLLVITRNYPPQVGGLENYSFNLIRELERYMPVKMMALSKSKLNLVWFLPSLWIRGVLAIRTGRIPIVHLCDALMAPIGCIFKALTRARISASVHGLDVTFPNRAYQKVIPRCLSRFDLLFCVSRSTRNECVQRGITPTRCVVIPNGIRPDEIFLPFEKAHLTKELETSLGTSFANRTILASVGRLVRRKGVGWFVENVMPRLDSRFVFVILGAGPEYSKIQSLIRKLRVENRVFLAGQQPDRVRNLLLNAADAFIMPNISIAGDVEGFGISALEAGSCGLPVIASGIQGIPDAVVEGVTGHLVREGDAEGFAARIESLDMDRSRIRKAVAERFSWERIGMEYALKFASLQTGAAPIDSPPMMGG
jgi:glycosyltransferase involved in cell wall biosynthesis